MTDSTRSFGVVLKSVKRNSSAYQAGLRSGDCLLKIDDHPIEDVLDVQFYLIGGESQLEFQRQDEVFHLLLETAPGLEVGWIFEPLQARSCHCDCTFCFVSQLPLGLRSTLYVKDEDYRFSFLFGNYLTLVGLKPHDLERILRLRLSPLYISIHAVDPLIRGRLLGLKKAPILPQLQQLIDGGITLHGQIVLVPGVNDGRVLVDSLKLLQSLYPGLVSLSVVPVGLTEHRQGLNEIRLLNSTDAESALEIVAKFQKQMLSSHGTRWVFPADELLLLVGQPFPLNRDYEDYPQLENGVGLVRWTLERAYEGMKNIPPKLPVPRSIIWATGRSAFPVLQTLAADLCASIGNLLIEVLPVDNRLLGESVTVAGLLGGNDVNSALENHYKPNPSHKLMDMVYLPPDCVNRDGFMLDDWTPAQIIESLRAPVQIFDGCWEAMLTGKVKRRQ